MRIEPPVPADVLAAVRAPFDALGAAAIDPPVIQPLNLILDLSGEAMRERLILVQADNGAEGALRPDFTIPAARLHIESGRAGGRYYYEGKAFRAAPRGREAYEEFLQIGLEAFEADDPPLADAAMAGLAWRAALAGGREDLTLLFGDVALFGAFLAQMGLAAPLAARLQAVFSRPWRLERELTGAAEATGEAPAGGLRGLLLGLSEAQGGAVLEEIWALAGVEPVGHRSAGEIVRRLAARAEVGAGPRLSGAEAAMLRRYLGIDGAPQASLAAVASLCGADHPALAAAMAGWERRLDAMAKARAPADRMRLSTAFGRGFGYYDGVLFEVRSAGLGEDEPVAAGGRYDSLPARLGHPRTTGAVGCMVRPARAWREGRA